jgi:hypothetical protein
LQYIIFCFEAATLSGCTATTITTTTLSKWQQQPNNIAYHEQECGSFPAVGALQLLAA